MIIPFDDVRGTDVREAGGKGASLASLTRAGFPVPGGVIVPAAAYRELVNAWPEFDSLVTGLPVSCDTPPEDLRISCAEFRTAMMEYALPASLETTLRRGLEALVDLGPVSVRSSATLEDLAGASFAGQHDSYLGVNGMTDVLDALRRCWASLWEDRAVRYRLEKGFGVRDADMAVVVQRMVDADVAGVAFSINPITGEANRALITSAWGLGETVVSGEGEVDQWVVDKQSGQVTDEHIGDKQHELVQTVGGGTRTLEVPADRRVVPSLTDDERNVVLDLTTRAERHYAFPQDIEWAVEGGEVFLLQSRPVTEFPERWTRQESAERFPNPITPLTWDFTTPGFHESLAYSLELMGMPPFDGEWFKRLDGYIYGNQTAVEIFAAGHQVAFDDLDDLAARMTEMRGRYRWVQELPLKWARDLDYYLLELGRLNGVTLEDLSLEALWDQALAVDRLGREYFLPNIAISLSQGLLHKFLFHIVAHTVGMEQAPAMYDGLTCFCETKTGLVNNDLFDLARIARGIPPLRRILTEEDRRHIVESDALATFPEFAEPFARFLKIHGHREVDFDAYHATWSGQPWVVLENLRLMLVHDEREDPADTDQELRVRQQETEQALLHKVPANLRVFVGEIARLARAYTSLDDLEHYQTTRLTPPFRAALVEIGRRLVPDGTLDQPEDVFFLHRSTLEGLIQRRVTHDEARTEAAANKAEYQHQLDNPPPFRHGETDEDVEDASEGLRGLPGAPGVAEGPVCILRSADDFGRFEPGSVLVARTTNPAWTPIFYSAAAVVTESGGPLSHGAVTAREFQIPAVMAVRNVMTRLKEGQSVRVDGSRGVVVVLD